MSGLGWLTGPLGYPFMQRALVTTLAVGVAAPVAGVWATSRRLVYLTDAMSHAILAAAALLGASLLAGGLVAAAVMALLVAVLVVRARLPEDSAIGVVGQGLFALGVIGVSQSTEPRALSHVLFGNPLTVTTTDVIIELAIAALVVAAAAGCLPLLVATTFDPGHARTLGVRTGLVDTAVILGLGLVVVIGLTTVGVLMALTLCIAPAAAARLLSSRRPRRHHRAGRAAGQLPPRPARRPRGRRRRADPRRPPRPPHRPWACAAGRLRPNHHRPRENILTTNPTTPLAGPAGRPDGTGRANAAALKAVVRDMLLLDDSHTVVIQQLACAEPGCPPVETVIAVLSAGAPTRRWTLHQPMAELTAESVRAALSPEGEKE
ncbi:metal ABC transporter permease [Frankia sp. CcWB3]